MSSTSENETTPNFATQQSEQTVCQRDVNVPLIDDDESPPSYDFAVSTLSITSTTQDATTPCQSSMSPSAYPPPSYTSLQLSVSPCYSYCGSMNQLLPATPPSYESLPLSQPTMLTITDGGNGVPAVTQPPRYDSELHPMIDLTCSYTSALLVMFLCGFVFGFIALVCVCTYNFSLFNRLLLVVALRHFVPNMNQ